MVVKVTGKDIGINIQHSAGLPSSLFFIKRFKQFQTKIIENQHL